MLNRKPKRVSKNLILNKTTILNDYKINKNIFILHYIDNVWITYVQKGKLATHVLISIKLTVLHNTV